MLEAAPVAAVLSDRFYVDNDQIRDNTYDIQERKVHAKRNVSGKMRRINIYEKKQQQTNRDKTDVVFHLYPKTNEL